VTVSNTVGALQTFFTKQSTTAVAPQAAAVIAEETALTADVGEHDHVEPTIEPVAVVATDSGFTHAREQYLR
jgi:hypothetical protein